MLKWLKEEGCPLPSKETGFPWDQDPSAVLDVVCAVARGGHLETLKWLREEGCPLPSKAYGAACASRGSKSLEILKWLRENGCPWHEETQLEVNRNGNFRVLKWLYNTSESLEWDKHTCYRFALSGNLKALKWLREKGCPWGKLPMELVTERGHLEMLKWLRENGRPWNYKKIALHAVKGGRFEVLKWVSENARFTWTERHCGEAAASDNLPLLKWLRKKGCPWDGQVCADAGSKKLLRWALANGCPFGVQEIEGVVYAGNLGIAERMYQILVPSRPNGKIEWQKDFFATIAQHGSRRQLEWLKAHGCLV